MRKFLIIVFIFTRLISLSVFSIGQTPGCNEIAQQIEKDTSKTIWDYEQLQPGVYYCLGKYFAKKDIKAGIYLIQTYGNPNWDDPCTNCKYEQHGFKFQYHWDVIWEEKTNFIKGYNEVSLAFLKHTIGAKAFAQLDNLPKSYFNPKKEISKFFTSKNRQKYYDIEEINDSLARVKILVDSIFKAYPKLVKKVLYHIRDANQSLADNNAFEILTYQQMTETGFLVQRGKTGKYSYDIKFDFKLLINDHLFCSCAFNNENEYSYNDNFDLR